MQAIFEGKKTAYITNQILGELFYTLTRNFNKPLEKEASKLIVSSIISSNNWTKLDYDSKTIDKAINLSNNYNISFWDCVISATMIENSIFTIYTENEKDFNKIPGIKVINPLSV